jgi:cobalt/nickel transport system permease protein
MHIPDGFLSAPAAIVLWLIAIVFIGLALRQANATLDERKLPLMGVLAAAIFAGQMLNFSVTGGTSGHLLGAALATILLGPWAATLVMTAVVSVQALFFQDGGLLALGANLVNMGVIGVWVSYGVYVSLRKLLGEKPWSLFASAAVTAWTSIFLAALACALELAVSGTSPVNVAIPAMGAIHALIGIGEALITTGALAFIYAARRDLLTQPLAGARAERSVWIGGLAIAALLAVLSPLASAHPDGLEWVAEQQNFLSIAQGPLYELLPDYTIPGISNEAISTILAGLVGLAIVAGVARLMTLRRSKAAQPR